MLIDGTVVEAMANIKQKNKSVWNTIKKAVQKLLDKWSAVIDQYKDRTADAEEATYFSETSKSFKKLQEMLTEAFVDASDTYSKVGNLKDENGETLSGQGIGKSAKATDTSGDGIGAVKQSESESARSDLDQAKAEDRMLSKDYINNLLHGFGITNPGDWLQVQKCVMSTLVSEGFFTNKEKRNRIDINAESGMIIETNKSGIDETFSQFNYKSVGRWKKFAKLATIRRLPEIIQQGHMIISDASNMHGGTATNKTFAYIEHTLEEDGKLITVKLDIKKSPQKNKFWVHKAIDVKSVSGLPASTDTGTEAGQSTTDTNDRITHTESEVKEKLSERDYPIDSVVEKMVDDAFSKSASSMNELGAITAEQNKAINRLVNQAGDESYRGKYEGGKHRFSDTAIRHIMSEHGDFLREGLRAQLPMRKEDIARHLSAIKENKMPSSIKPTRTSRGNPSILTSYEVNGYTLYAEEITKSLGKNLPSDLIGHTMYKAPTLATAAAPATSAGVLPRRQDQVLCNYNMPNNGNLSRGNFVADKNGRPVLLHYVSKKGSPNVDILHGGLIALSSDESNLTDQSGIVEQGYVLCEKPYYITQDHRIFDNSKADVSAKVSELKKQGYDCFIFDKIPGDNYMVAVVNKAQIVKTAPTVIEEEKASERTIDSTSARFLLANALESTIDTSTQEGQIELKRLEEYQEMIGTLDDLNSQLIELREGIFLKGVDSCKMI